MQMKTESIEYQDGDLVLRGFLAYDDTQSGRRPGVLVMPGGFGLGDNAKSRAEKLARLGYVALAGDPYGEGIEVDDLKVKAMKTGDSTASLTRRSSTAGCRSPWKG